MVRVGALCQQMKNNRPCYKCPSQAKIAEHIGSLDIFSFGGLDLYIWF